MSSRRLVNRQGRQSAASKTPAVRTQLPPYQAPQCPLNDNARGELEALGTNYDNKTYVESLRAGAKYLADALAETSEVLNDHRKKLDQLVEKRQRKGKEGNIEWEEKIEDQIKNLEVKIKQYLVQGEKAVRELVDYEVESNGRRAIIQRIVERYETAPDPAPRERTRHRKPTRDRAADPEDEGSSDESEESEDESIPVPQLSELLDQARHESQASFEAKSLQDRYAKSNHYKMFRKVMHDAKYGEEVEEPPPENWFRPEGTYSPESQPNVDGDDSDDDVVIQSANINVKCPLTLVDLTEPLSNNNCKHVYEKTPFLQYIRKNGTAFRDKGTEGHKKVKCMVGGCDKMIAEEDCYEDPIIARKVKKALAQARRLEEGDCDEDEEDNAPPGSQSKRPAEIDDDDVVEGSREAKKRLTIGKIKAERMSRGVSSWPTPAGQGEDEEQNGDSESDDEDT